MRTRFGIWINPMRHTRPFQVHIEPPTGRWLIITFQTPTAPVQCGPSAILSDPIGDLVAALVVTAQSPAPVHFQWHEEPVLVDGAFHTTAQETRFTLIRSDQTAPPELLLAITAPRMVILRPFWRALRRLQSQLDPDAYAAQMGHAFPGPAMHQFTNWMQAHKERDHP